MATLAHAQQEVSPEKCADPPHQVRAGPGACRGIERPKLCINDGDPEACCANAYNSGHAGPGQGGTETLRGRPPVAAIQQILTFCGVIRKEISAVLVQEVVKVCGISPRRAVQQDREVSHHRRPAGASCVDGTFQRLLSCGENGWSSISRPKQDPDLLVGFRASFAAPVVKSESSCTALAGDGESASKCNSAEARVVVQSGANLCARSTA